MNICVFIEERRENENMSHGALMSLKGLLSYDLLSSILASVVVHDNG